jgi:hypothetical protein
VEAANALATFERFLAARGTATRSLDASSAVDAMIDFYVTVRAGDVDLADSGDTLLFQYGTYDWSGEESFEYDITRQFIITEVTDDDEAFLQLSLTLHYEPAEEARLLESGNEWCEGRDGVSAFRDAIRTNPATAYALHSTPTRIELDIDRAG